jgi:hypothetical protein
MSQEGDQMRGMFQTINIVVTDGNRSTPIFWVTRKPSGIYAGDRLKLSTEYLPFPKTEQHYSYHANGTLHYRKEPPFNPEALPMYDAMYGKKGIKERESYHPLNKFSGHAELAEGGIAITSHVFFLNEAKVCPSDENIIFDIREMGKGMLQYRIEVVEANEDVLKQRRNFAVLRAKGMEMLLQDKFFTDLDPNIYIMLFYHPLQ